MTPTTPVTATTRNGETHSFLMGFSAKRRIMRRLRSLQLKGELDSDLKRIEAIDNIELAYITLAETRLDSLSVPEDEFLEQFDDSEIGQAANQLWTRFQLENPTRAAVAEDSPQSEKTTMLPAASGQGG